jgi:hypothetical protein
MSQPLRIEYPTAYDHVINRGLAYLEKVGCPLFFLRCVGIIMTHWRMRLMKQSLITTKLGRVDRVSIGLTPGSSTEILSIMTNYWEAIWI